MSGAMESVFGWKHGAKKNSHKKGGSSKKSQKKNQKKLEIDKKQHKTQKKERKEGQDNERWDKWTPENGSKHAKQQGKPIKRKAEANEMSSHHQPAQQAPKRAGVGNSNSEQAGSKQGGGGNSSGHQPVQTVEPPQARGGTVGCEKKKKRKKRKKNAPAGAGEQTSTSVLAKPTNASIAGEQNEYLEVFQAGVRAWPSDMHRLLDPTLGDDRREQLFDLLEPEWAEQYGWAVPDARALNIISRFGPIVEIGAGLGYWGSLLLKRGVDYVGYDTSKTAGNKEEGAQNYKNWCTIKKGGPEKLDLHPHHTLMLCYPDDYEVSRESLALKCLERYQGDTVVLIGELFGGTILENPWGRSCGGDFQQELALAFHMVLRVPLPSQPLSMDCLTIWKRTPTIEVDDMVLRVIPDDQRVDMTLAAPDFKKLL